MYVCVLLACLYVGRCAQCVFQNSYRIATLRLCLCVCLCGCAWVGTWQYTHMRGDPVKVRDLSNKRFYNERTRSLDTIRIKYISCGARHVAGALAPRSHTHTQ
jgi:hypothetical protein